MNNLAANETNYHPNDDMPPDSGPRYTAPTPAESRELALIAGANLRGLIEVLVGHEHLGRMIQTLNTGDPVEPKYLEAAMRSQLQRIAEALTEATALQAKMEAQAATNCAGGLVILPAED